MITIKKIKRRSGFRVTIVDTETSTKIETELGEQTLAKLIDQGIAALIRAQRARKGK